MEMLPTDQILRAGLRDWRKLAQAIHARYRVGDLAAGARFISAIASDAHVGHRGQPT